MAVRKNDLFAIVAGTALTRANFTGDVFEVTCNCGARCPSSRDNRFDVRYAFVRSAL